MVRADIFIRFFGSFLIQNCGSDFSDFWPPPPLAAKWVRLPVANKNKMASIETILF